MLVINQPCGGRGCQGQGQAAREDLLGASVPVDKLPCNLGSGSSGELFLFILREERGTHHTCHPKPPGCPQCFCGTAVLFSVQWEDWPIPKAACRSVLKSALKCGQYFCCLPITSFGRSSKSWAGLCDHSLVRYLTSLYHTYNISYCNQ